MLTKLAESSNGEAGFRRQEISPTVTVRGWAKMIWATDYITFFEITPEGRQALIQQRAKGR
jgi:hypothetical protein